MSTAEMLSLKQNFGRIAGAMQAAAQQHDDTRNQMKVSSKLKTIFGSSTLLDMGALALSLMGQLDFMGGSSMSPLFIAVGAATTWATVHSHSRATAARLGKRGHGNLFLPFTS